MDRTLGGSILTTLIALLMTVTLVAAPVQRDDAFLAAKTELPGFFVGPWKLAGELTLHNLSGDIVAYTFMFSRPKKQSDVGVQEDTPVAFVAKTRANLASKGKPVSGNATELYGEDRFASIVISADDTEPPVLRCFLGLPPHVVKAADALALAAKTGGAWRVRHYLMLGFFDEAFALEVATGTAAPLVVDMRTRSAMPHANVKASAKARKAAVSDPERIRKCQEAWQRYRGSK